MLQQRNDPRAVDQDAAHPPRDVAEQGFKALMAGKDHIYASSLKTKVQGELGRFIPQSVKAEMHRKEAEPKAQNE